MSKSIFAKISGFDQEVFDKALLADETDYSAVDFCQGESDVFLFDVGEEEKA